MALLLSWDECLQNYDYPQRFFCPQPHTTSKRAKGVNSRAHSSTCFLRWRGNYQQQDQPWNAYSSLGSVHLLVFLWLPVWVSSSCCYLGEHSLHCQVGPKTPKLSSSNLQQLHYIIFDSNIFFVDPITMSILCNIQARRGPLSKQPSKWTG